MRLHSKRLHLPRGFSALVLACLVFVMGAIPEATAHAAAHRKATRRNPTLAQRRSHAGSLRGVKHGAAHTPPPRNSAVQNSAAQTSRARTSKARAALVSARAMSRHRHRPLRPSNQNVRELIPAIPRVGYVPALKGSRESLVRQNVISSAEGLNRIENDSQLQQMVASNELVMLPSSSGLHINDAMPMNRRYCRPWTAKFLTDLARVHAERFRPALIVTSAVRTAEYQRHLLLINGNAAPAEGELASPHLTGATIDIAKKGMSMSEIGWLRAYLLPLQTAGKIDVAEEFRQACFHITVYNGYLPPETIPAVSAVPAASRHGSRSVILAARLR